uniref:Major facilitator superfamily (MFS) profile domain-containing protein n=1 Tax=Chromera velia CCMP2878 TaxID=1169474 RepID=A0A0G4HBE3_9ALVE|eukprot:Cvel_927.t1-p1 / transcript=Cvel_927.t1 / gene=Cvel_927 / organism=Chromera_velia_CCMP2878 / gene_product=Disrupted in renal carcinoma protein 2 homolog, putative / transcript_product=Disrupted in renal carcinoma protein 2 homolog, putative / location=Cvel_scaffold29:113956-116384(-) / protein_length=622 / sequence_SO=supercontig / SO=protein_coding / is_pseudo=false
MRSPTQEADPLLSPTSTVEYRADCLLGRYCRWYILFVFFGFGALQSWQQSLPGPIAVSILRVTGFDEDTSVKLWLTWGVAFFIPFSLPFAFWIDAKASLRPLILLASTVMTLGACVRCIAASLDSTEYVRVAFVLFHLSYVLNAMAGPVALSGAAKLSALWFPSHQRSIATAVAQEANAVGDALAFLVGPFLMRGAGGAVSGGPPWALGTDFEKARLTEATAYEVRALRMYYQLVAILCILNLICIAVYFPAAPPRRLARLRRQQSVVGEMTANEFGASVKSVLRERGFVILAVTYGLMYGTCDAWLVSLDLNVQGLHVSQTVAGWVGFSGALGGCLLGINAGWLSDMFHCHREIIVSLVSVAAVCMILLLFMLGVEVTDWMQTDDSRVMTQAVVLSFLISCCNTAAVPIVIEKAVEKGPASHAGVAAILCTCACNLGAFAFELPSGLPATAVATVCAVVCASVLAFVVDWGQSVAPPGTGEDEEEDALSLADGIAPLTTEGGGEGEGETSRVIREASLELSEASVPVPPSRSSSPVGDQGQSAALGGERAGGVEMREYGGGGLPVDLSSNRDAGNGQGRLGGRGSSAEGGSLMLPIKPAWGGASQKKPEGHSQSEETGKPP